MMPFAIHLCRWNVHAHGVLHVPFRLKRGFQSCAALVPGSCTLNLGFLRGACWDWRMPFESTICPVACNVNSGWPCRALGGTAKAKWHHRNFADFSHSCQDDFDIILMSFALHHLNEAGKGALLKQAHRLLKSRYVHAGIVASAQGPFYFCCHRCTTIAKTRMQRHLRGLYGSCCALPQVGSTAGHTCTDEADSNLTHSFCRTGRAASSWSTYTGCRARA